MGEGAQSRPETEDQPRGEDGSRQIAEAILPGRPEDAGELARLLRSPTARILLPPDSDLAVRLVHVKTLDRLFELQSDSNLYRGGLVLAIGALIGFFTNVVTTNDFVWTTAPWVFLAVSSALALLFGTLAVRYNRRVAKLRREIEASDGNSNES